MLNKDNTDSLPWIEKYRPTTFDELISHKNILDTIDKFIEKNELPHLLFYGPPGTGKTSSILSIARKLYGNNCKQMILELNASDDRKIDTVRNQIKDFASTQKIFSNGVKLIILDEADAMTQAAQAALRRIIEKYTKNTRFCLICNYISKLIPALQSRCTRFRFAPLKTEQILPRLEEIGKKEKVNLTEDGMRAIITLSQGDMRKCINILQSTHMAFDKIDETNVYTCTGRPLPNDISLIFTWLSNLSFSETFSKIEGMIVEKSIALEDIISELHSLILKIDFGKDSQKSQLAKMKLFDSFAKIEENLHCGVYYKLQLGHLIGAFHILRSEIDHKI
eukprot:TRINITY_DN12277_c0_g1_i1.p1 TRINITY_DN12277_c0_g1~~TRINITY_DN12277_c0_g1_i1.p1  ORF type:complete len:336 (-),score=79.58 TRINITY_DN12277_c0_g1_i1:179-1186(-)